MPSLLLHVTETFMRWVDFLFAGLPREDCRMYRRPARITYSRHGARRRRVAR